MGGRVEDVKMALGGRRSAVTVVGDALGRSAHCSDGAEKRVYGGAAAATAAADGRADGEDSGKGWPGALRSEAVGAVLWVSEGGEGVCSGGGGWW